MYNGSSINIHEKPTHLIKKTAIIRCNCSSNLYLNGGTLDLNARKLTVQGTIYQSGGTLYVNGGEVEVWHDYLIEDGDSHSTGHLKMTNAADTVTVHGDFVMNSKYNHNGYLTSGVLEIKGSFTQKSTSGDGYPNYPNNNFSASSGHKTVLSGEGIQTVSFEDPGDSMFNVLDIKNEMAAKNQ